jgi:hypothetical protein
MAVVVVPRMVGDSKLASGTAENEAQMPEAGRQARPPFPSLFEPGARG